LFGRIEVIEKEGKVSIPTFRFMVSGREYVNGIVHNLSLQRLTDQEIVDWLREEKKISLDRSTISKMRNREEQQAEKWYIELKESRYKYIANYKAILDSLLSYQKKLNQIIEFYLQPPMQILYPDTIIKAVAELHRIEVSMFNIWRQLPDFDIVDKVKQQKEETQEEDRNLHVVSIEDINGVEEIPEEDKKYWHNWIQCNGCKRWWRGQELLDCPISGRIEISYSTHRDTSK
jgi:hypothetical protein